MKKLSTLSLISSLAILLSITSCVGLSISIGGGGDGLSGVPFNQMQVNSNNITNGVGSFTNPIGSGTLSYGFDNTNLYLLEGTNLSSIWNSSNYSNIGTIQQIAPSYINSSLLVLNSNNALFACTNYMSLGCVSYTMPSSITGTVTGIAGNNNIQYTTTSSPFGIYSASGNGSYIDITSTLVTNLTTVGIISSASDISTVSIHADSNGNLVYIFTNANGQNFYIVYNAISATWGAVHPLNNISNIAYGNDGSVFFVDQSSGTTCINNTLQFTMSVIKQGSSTVSYTQSIMPTNCMQVTWVSFNNMNVDLNNNIYVGVGSSNLSNNIGVFYANGAAISSSAR
jgi:hypothetical protein